MAVPIVVGLRRRRDRTDKKEEEGGRREGEKAEGKGKKKGTRPKFIIAGSDRLASIRSDPIRSELRNKRTTTIRSTR